MESELSDWRVLNVSTVPCFSGNEESLNVFELVSEVMEVVILLKIKIYDIGPLFV